MAETIVGWRRVLSAFDDWIEYETSVFGPYTGYFNKENLRGLTSGERIGWMKAMVEEIIPGRVEMCQHVRIALEDFLPYMPGADTLETVRSMIELCGVIQESMLKMSDVFSDMIEEYQSGGIEEIMVYISTVADYEEEIRHHMSLFSKGFGKLKKLGLDIPAEMQ